MANTGQKAGLLVVTLVALAAACGGKSQEAMSAPAEGGKGPGMGASGNGQGGVVASAGRATNIGGGSTASGGVLTGVGGSDVAGTGNTAGAAEPELPLDPYAPRTGSFKMLVYSHTQAFRHTSSIFSGELMLEQIASEQGFEVQSTESNELFTPAGLNQFEIVFFLNTSGNIFNAEEELAFETWMTTRHGAFVGVHSATATEPTWHFYTEVTGQFYDGHGPQNAIDKIVFEADALDHPAIQGLPKPWERAEEWPVFKSSQQWQTEPGFQILGRKAADSEPIIWARQWGNFRSFYTGLGHDAVVFQDAKVKQHLTGGIMWAVRREHLIQ